MKPYTLFDEIFSWNRSTDDEPVSPTGKGALSDYADLLDETRPFSELFQFSPSDGTESGLVARLHADDLLSKVLGPDLNEALRVVHPAMAVALDQRILQISQQAVGNLIEKATCIAAGAPLRKRAIAAIVERAKTATAGFDSHSEESRALWDCLQSSCEKYVAEVLAST